jgi:hypothetical protein
MRRLRRTGGGAAAFALASSIDREDAILRRVRIAAEATTSEPLRIASGSAAGGELEQAAVESALEDVRERVRSRGTS